ncbi:MAG: hypothetical protein GXY44_04525 [Phycisphaerales bacterium]|nr:hypothetical protein [Phycisphaerales bacterium]
MGIPLGRKYWPCCLFLLAAGYPALAAGAEPTTNPATAPASRPSAAIDGFRLWACPTPPATEILPDGESVPPFIFRAPWAVHDTAAQKTFFVYTGILATDGTSESTPRPAVMTALFDHQNGTVTRPVIVCRDTPAGGCPEPALVLDEQGYLYVFVSNGPGQPSHIYRSRTPRSIDAFESIFQADFVAPQPWYIPKHGFLLIHLQPHADKNLVCFSTSPDGLAWSEPQPIAALAAGHRMVSGRFNHKVGVAFSYEEQPGLPTDLFYLQTSDFGSSWQTADGMNMTLPITEPGNEALLRDYKSMNRVVYPKDMNFDRAGYPAILYVSALGPQFKAPRKRRVWYIARWFRDWEITGLITSNHNLDAGCLHITPEIWYQLFAPTDPGPQPKTPGGDINVWVSADRGRSWSRARLTADHQFNHQDVRRPIDASDDLYAFWVRGDARKGTHGRILFCDSKGQVFILPEKMDTPVAQPERVTFQQ